MPGISSNRIYHFLRYHNVTKHIYRDVIPCDSKNKWSKFPHAYVMVTDTYREWVRTRQVHSIAIYAVDEENVEFFDPAGDPPNACILEYLKNFRNIKTNALKLQAYNSPTCGFYSMYFIFRRAEGASVDSIVEELASKKCEREGFVQDYIERKEGEIKTRNKII